MAIDEALAGRVRLQLAGVGGVVEKKMFGGIAFLVGGNMSVGVHGSELIVRMKPEDAESALKKSGVRPFDMTGSPMKGWLFVSSAALGQAKSLEGWVSRGVEYARSLPAK